jgi:hypothetical protein
LDSALGESQLFFGLHAELLEWIEANAEEIRFKTVEVRENS